MNIFFLDTNPTLCAAYHCDKHISKMILESTQMLCTALREQGYTQRWLYKSTHENHPSTCWISDNPDAFVWLWRLATELNAEKDKRFYSGDHKSIHVANAALDLAIENGLDIAQGLKSPPPKVMPGEFFIPGNSFEAVVESYRNYYHSKSFIQWRSAPPPWWSPEKNYQHIKNHQ